MSLLTDEEIQQHLGQLNTAWALVSGSTLDRVYEFPDFKTALAFVNEIGTVAEQHNHHPDITLSWGKVVLSVSSHDAGGLTVKDFELAKVIDKLSV